jgi:hypothetical protein
MPAQPDLPLRPLTRGELLDAAVSLLRARALPLLGAALVLALLEQVLLAPLRSAAFATPPYYLPARGHFAAWWQLVAVGFACETAILVLLGALAAAAAGPALIGRAVRHRELWRRARPVSSAVAAALIGIVCGAGFGLGVLPGLLCYGLCGLTSATLVIDRAGNPFTALGRSARLVTRGGIRGVWTLLAAYLVWFAIRLALGSGWVSLLSLLTGADLDLLSWLTPAAWALANTVAYAALACVAAVVLLDTRIRSEGLDIAISRARARGEDDAAVLVYAP